MKNLTYIALIIALVSLIIGLIGRLINIPIFGIAPITYLSFTNTCLLFTLSFGLLQILKTKEKEE